MKVGATMEIDWSSHFHRLLHKQVTRVALEQWSMTLLIDDSELRVEGDWYLYGTNNIFDKNQGFIERQAFELWRLIGTEITRIDVFNEHLPKIFFTSQRSGGLNFLPTMMAWKIGL